MKLAIIGNGRNANESETGDFIDSCDEVIRMNNFVTKGFEEFTGTKTTIYGMLPYHYETERWMLVEDLDSISSVKMIWASRPEPFVKYDLSKVLKKLKIKKEVIFVNEHHWYSMKKKYADIAQSHDLITNKGMCPSTGLVLINMALTTFRGWEIYVKGFDLSTNCYYWEDKPIERMEGTRVQDFWIKDLVDKGILKTL